MFKNGKKRFLILKHTGLNIYLGLAILIGQIHHAIAKEFGYNTNMPILIGQSDHVVHTELHNSIIMNCTPKNRNNTNNTFADKKRQNALIYKS